MKTYFASALLSCLAFTAACNDDSSSSDPAPVPTSEGNAIVAPPTTAPEETPPGPVEEVVQLNSSFLEYSRLQYDCGDLTKPLAAEAVEANLKGAKSFESLAATIPAKDQALVKISTIENGMTCSYRALFTVNKAFTEVTFASAQSLNTDSRAACATSKATIDAGFGTSPVAFEYDKKFIRWVALRIPTDLQLAPVCASGNLRAVFAGAAL
ncbi:MAG: hypothetical protein EOP10_03865 [Proteobacteria bacterium]|nr:MAG: hypothetical protein EOP10_03865 [Pseudomonadota bacterium]